MPSSWPGKLPMRRSVRCVVDPVGFPAKIKAGKKNQKLGKPIILKSCVFFFLGGENVCAIIF